MEYDEAIQNVLDYVDENITDDLVLENLAELAGYSVYHFSRLFSDAVGVPVMTYVTWRRLQYSLFDLSTGKKVIDVAMEYGFDTHAGFTKAFKRCFGFPPSLCYLHLAAKPPGRQTLGILKLKLSGGNFMNPHIIELSPFSVIGYPGRHTLPNVKRTADIPGYWDTLMLNYGDILTRLHNRFTKSKHFEISMCYDVDMEKGDFTYLLGRGIDNSEDLVEIEPDMTRYDITGGLYAVFSTPLVQEKEYIQSIHDTWTEILTHWLPQSEFEFDETRPDFEYYDHRDHGWYFGGRVQMDICIPIRQSEEAVRKSKLRMDG